MTDAESIALRALVLLAHRAERALDDSEEFEGPDGRAHSVDGQNFDDVCEALDALDGLPDDKPGHTLSLAGRAEWALRRLLEEADRVEAFGPTADPDLDAERYRWARAHGILHIPGQPIAAATPAEWDRMIDAELPKPATEEDREIYRSIARKYNEGS